MQTLHKDKFSCDRQAKYDFTASTVAYFDSLYTSYSLEFYEFDKDNHFIEFDSACSSEHSRLDLGMKLSIAGKDDVYYVFELKERWGKYVSTLYGEEGQEGWMYNQPKDEVLRKASESGCIPIYVNLYPDGVVRIWNLNKVTEVGHITKTYNKYNVVASPMMVQERLTLMNKQGVSFQRIIGEKSDGRWRKESTK